MYNDYSGAAAGLGFGVIIVGIIVYFGTIALLIWIGYLITRTAVKNGVIRAYQEMGFTPGAMPPPAAPGYPPHPRGPGVPPAQ